MVGAHTESARRTSSPRRCASACARRSAGSPVEAYELLDELGLGRRRLPAGAPGLPFGTLKRIELARALAGEPKLLMLDEPASGLTHAEVDELGRARSATLRDRYSLTVLLVEHHMAMVMGISDKVVVLDFGRKIAEGTPAEVPARPRRSIEAYLGGRRHERRSGRLRDALLEVRGPAGRLRPGRRCSTASTSR